MKAIVSEYSYYFLILLKPICDISFLLGLKAIFLKTIILDMFTEKKSHTDLFKQFQRLWHTHAVRF